MQTLTPTRHGGSGRPSHLIWLGGSALISKSPRPIRTPLMGCLPVKDNGMKLNICQPKAAESRVPKRGLHRHMPACQNLPEHRHALCSERATNENEHTNPLTRQ